jgi:hypothetical protein
MGLANHDSDHLPQYTYALHQGVLSCICMFSKFESVSPNKRAWTFSNSEAESLLRYA